MKTLFSICLFTFSLFCFSQTEQEQDSTKIHNTKNTPEIMIRCTTSISDDSEPLIIIDGLPSSSKKLSELNPKEIKSVELIKDIEALQCFGTKGSNGVVLITTSYNKSPEKVNISPFKVYTFCSLNENWNSQQDVLNSISVNVPGFTVTQILGNTPVIASRGEQITKIIIDGIKHDVSILNSISPNDIEKVEVSHNPQARDYLGMVIKV